MQLEFYDATCRDGNQSPDIDLKPWQKLEIAKALDRLGCDIYCELGWPINSVDKETFKLLKDINFDYVIVTAFGSTRKAGISAEKDENLLSIVNSGAKVATIFGKSDLEHVTYALGTTPEGNLQMISDSIQFLRKNGLRVFFDAEHFFDGYRKNPSYALEALSTAAKAGAERLVLCDTNGGTMPHKMQIIFEEVKKYLKSKNINTPLGIHCHNDSGNAVANSLHAVLGGAVQVHGCINGFGERTGNADLIALIASIMLGFNDEDWAYLSGLGIEKPSIDLSLLKELSDFVYTMTGLKPNPRQPFVGDFTGVDTGGVHRDAERKKKGLYRAFDLSLVGNSKVKTVLSSQSGSAHILDIAERLGYKIPKEDPKIRAALEEVKNLSARGYSIKFLEAEQELLLMKHLALKFPLQIISWSASTGSHNGSIKSTSELHVLVNGEEQKGYFEVENNGPVDALYRNLQRIIAKAIPFVNKISLEGFNVSTVDGTKSKGPESLVRVYVEFKDGHNLWGTVGVSTNILGASLEAIDKGFNYYLLKHKN